MSTSIKYISLFLSLAFWSCGSKVEKSSLKTFSVDLKNATEIPLSSIASEVSYIALETTENNLISTIREIDHNDEHIFISDFNSLYHFSIDGQFNKKLGTKGEGPGEFMGIRSTAIDWEKKHIYLATIRKLICLDFDGQLIKEVKLSMLDGLTLINGKLIALKTAIGLPSNEAGMSNNKTYRIEILDNLELGDTTILRQVKVPAGNGTMMPYGMSFISEVKDKEFIYFPVPYNESIVRDTLYQIANNQTIPEIKIDFGVRDKTAERFEIMNMLRTNSFLFANYANKGNLESTLISLSNASAYSVKEGFTDDSYNTGKAKLKIWNANEEQFYFVKDAFELEGIMDDISIDDNPYIFIVKLKR